MHKIQPEDLTAFAALMTEPGGNPVVAILVGWFGPLEEGEQQLKPLRQFLQPLADMVKPISYCQLQSMLDDGAPFGWYRYWKSGYFQELSDEFILMVPTTIAWLPLSVSTTQITFFATTRTFRL